MKRTWLLLMTLILASCCYGQVDTNYANEAMTALNQYDYTAALYYFNKALLKSPFDSTIYSLRGGVKKELNDYRGAIADYDTALSIRPDDIYVLHYRCRAKIELGDTAGATADIDKSLSQDPGFVWAWIDRGDILVEKREYKAALAAFTWAIDGLTPIGTYAPCEAYRQRGLLWWRLGWRWSAMDDLDKAVSINSGDIESLLDRADIYGEQRKYKKALADIATAMLWHPNDSRAVCGRGVIYLDWHRKKKAYSDLMKAKEMGNKYADELIKKHFK
jgi:tetratricopeptide (TPR) repeat protein